MLTHNSVLRCIIHIFRGYFPSPPALSPLVMVFFETPRCEGGGSSARRVSQEVRRDPKTDSSEARVMEERPLSCSLTGL